MQNSVRHNLSLSRNFHRVGVGLGEDVKMKKGLQWEVIPERREVVKKEIELYNESNLDTRTATGAGGCFIQC